ncbi:type II secretion system GspH family protein [Patescibacteria group bacterium]|nr:type II secretion system GspH family protein [Patescibacteria group bacterium]
MKRQDDLQKGFSLLELLVVIAVIGVLAALIFVLIDPGARMAQARDAQRKSDLRQIANALDAYFVENTGYPFPCDCIQTQGGCSSANPSSWHVVSLSAVLDVLIGEGYLRELYSDPINDAFASVWQTDGSSYFYVSETGMGGVAGDYYMIGAFLENENDFWTLDNLGGDPNIRPKYPDCSTNIGFDGRIYLIRSYRCDNDPIGSL